MCHIVISLVSSFRLTPVYLIIVAFYATLFYKMDSGPLWESKIGVEKDRCAENWWANMLYINNYYNSDRMVSIP